jgi:hypothetical protein
MAGTYEKKRRERRDVISAMMISISTIMTV